MSARKSDNLSEFAEVSKRERHSPFWEGLSESHDKQKTVPYKPESDHSDEKQAGKLFFIRSD